MNKLLILLSILTVLSCKEEKKTTSTLPKKVNADFVIVTGQVKNRFSDSVSIYKGLEDKRMLQLDDNGKFRDTFRLLSNEVYGFYDGKNGTFLFLENGYDINIKYDAKNFDETVVFSGKNAYNSKYMLEKTILEETLLDTHKLSDLTKVELNKKIKKISNELNAFYTKDTKIDTMLTQHATKSLKHLIKGYHDFIDEKINLKNELPKGSKSPDFKDFEDHKGNKVSLSDFKGKYVYINFWASWCDPCFDEIKAITNLVETYKNKNIEFIGISTNDGSFFNQSITKAKEAWKAKIKELKLNNTQLILPNGKANKFLRAYRVSGIPIYIIIDPDGNIVTPYAPNPSSKATKELLYNLLQ